MPFQARSPRSPRQLPVLPRYYYHDNFCDFLGFVDRRYAHVLEDKHNSFISKFRNLSLDSQCLYVRLAGRKGVVFDANKLPYDEIRNIESQIEILKSEGFVASVSSKHYADFLTTLTKPDLVTLLANHLCATAYKKSWKKTVLVDVAVSHLPFANISVPTRFIVQTYSEPLQYLSFLYFGKIEENLQNFTLRDLGLVKTPDFKDKYEARFDTLAQARSAYFYASSLHIFKNGNENEVTNIIDTLENWPMPECDISEASRDKLLRKIGGLSERLGDVEMALTFFGQSDDARANERVIRLRYAKGDKDWCKARLEELIENPVSDAEYDFAEDFYARKFGKKRTSVVTDILRAGEELELDESQRNTPELAALKHYMDQGYSAYFSENGVWRTLFGLLFWDELFSAENARFHNSFERLPANLKSGQFYNEFQASLEVKLDRLSDPRHVHIEVLKTVSRNHGKPNGVFRWNGQYIDQIKELILAAPPQSLAHILRLMAQNYKGMKAGYPDLMLIKNEQVRFVEVKAEGDVIRRNQLTRIRQLRTAGFQTDIARIEWIVDPDQIYVVVDVETTGGRPGQHRLTEIGAVKIQNGKMIGEWSTLLNPGRPIPPNIIGLTGITNEMVRGAPIFADIVDEFTAFLGDAIFAAHNVGFDYKFMKAEFRLVDRVFNVPKICTCASMRKFFPGYKSYSLKNLCREFDIDLTSHHRALCDAKAAAELLLLVNEKRLAK